MEMQNNETINTAPQPMQGAPMQGAQMQGGYFYQPYPMPTVVKPIKKKTEFTAAECAFSFVCVALSFLLFRFAVCEPTGFITTGVFIAITTAVLIFMKKAGKKSDGRTGLTAGIMYVFSAVYSITANEFVKMLNTVFLIIMCIWLVYQLGSDENGRKVPRFLPMVIAKAALDMPFGNFSKMPEAAVASAKKTKLGRNIGLIAAGLVVTVPLTVVVAALLMSADKGVEDMLGGIAEFILSDDMFFLVFQLGAAIPIGCYLFGLLFANAHRDKDSDLTEEACRAKLEKSRTIHNVLLYAGVTPICFLYLMFFISQANYLMSAFGGRLPEGYSFAEYARRGFFELLAIAVINLAVILFINFLAKNSGGKKPAALKVYTVIISFFTLVMIASALSKMVMYISVYGLTELRIYTGWFMVLMAFGFVMVIVKQFKDFNIMRPMSGVFIVMFALLMFGRPDFVIAKYNTEMSRSGKLKYYNSSYLLELSDDAVGVYLEEGCNNGVLTAETLDSIEERYDSEPLSKWNFSSLKVAREMEK